MQTEGVPGGEPGIRVNNDINKIHIWIIPYIAVCVNNFIALKVYSHKVKLYEFLTVSI